MPGSKILTDRKMLTRVTVCSFYAFGIKGES